MENMPTLPQPFHYEKKKPVKLILGVVLVFVLIGAVVWAVSQTVNNVGFINTPTNIAVSHGSLTQPNCDTVAYLAPGVQAEMQWGNQNPNQPLPVNGYFCVKNTGEQTVTLTVTGQPPTNFGSATYTISPDDTTPLGTGAIRMITIHWTITGSGRGGVTWGTTVTTTP